MIARYWSATTTKPPVEYRRHFTDVVVPNLQALDGFRGCYLLEKAPGDDVPSGPGPAETRFVALTLWESTDAIRAFAGDDITRSHVEPKGRAALTAFDHDATNFEVSVHVEPAS